MHGAIAWLRGLLHFTEAVSGDVSLLTAKGSSNQAARVAGNGGGPVMLGGNFSLGSDVRKSVGLGDGGFLSAPGEAVFSIGAYSGELLSQHGSWHAQYRTDDATPTVLTLNGEPTTSGDAWEFFAQTGDIFYIRAKFCAGTADGSAKAFVTEIKWAVTYLDGSLVQLGATNTSFSVATPGLTWTVVPYVANGRVSATVTGEAGVAVFWSAEFQYNRLRVSET